MVTHIFIQGVRHLSYWLVAFLNMCNFPMIIMPLGQCMYYYIYYYYYYIIYINIFIYKCRSFSSLPSEYYKVLWSVTRRPFYWWIRLITSTVSVLQLDSCRWSQIVEQMAIHMWNIRQFSGHESFHVDLVCVSFFFKWTYSNLESNDNQITIAILLRLYRRCLNSKQRLLSSSKLIHFNCKQFLSPGHFVLDVRNNFQEKCKWYRLRFSFHIFYKFAFSWKLSLNSIQKTST